MARVKDQGEASVVTISSKNRRWARLADLFGIKRLGELFPQNSTPNDADNNHLVCSGDVLRDLCMIGEELNKRGMSKEQMRSRVKRSFTAGIQVRHGDVRQLLARVRNGTIQQVARVGIDHGYVASLQTDVQRASTTESHTVSTPGLNIMRAEHAQYVDDDMAKPSQQTETEDEASGSTSQSIDPFLRAESSELIHQSIEGGDGYLQVPKEDEASPPPFNIFEQTEVSGPRKAKARASRGITQDIEKEVSDDERGIERQEGGIEYEVDDIIQARSRTTVTPGASSARLPSSLRPIEEDGFADAYVRTQHPMVQRNSLKRKSAPSTLQAPGKRFRLSSTPSGASYQDNERETLLSCLRMTQILMTDAHQKLYDGDVDGAQDHVSAVLSMAEQVLTKFAQ